jgi:hypothetical protein
MTDPTFLNVLSSWSQAAVALATIGLLLFAVFAWCTAKHTLRESRKASHAAQQSAEAALAANEQLRRDSIAQTRPYVFVEVLPGLGGVASWDIRITNTGRSTARKLAWEPHWWPGADDAVTLALREFTKERVLPPGSSIRAIWRVEGPGVGAVPSRADEMGMDRQVPVDVKYRRDDPDGIAYVDTFDMNTHGAGLWPVPEEGPVPSKLDATEKQFYKLLQVLVRRIGELGR